MHRHGGQELTVASALLVPVINYYILSYNGAKIKKTIVYSQPREPLMHVSCVSLKLKNEDE